MLALVNVTVTYSEKVRSRLQAQSVRPVTFSVVTPSDPEHWHHTSYEISNIAQNLPKRLHSKTYQWRQCRLPVYDLRIFAWQPGRATMAYDQVAWAQGMVANINFHANLKQVLIFW